ncbi:MAG: terminase large subunit [Hydrogenibacillus schlegelii]|nr:terminase large subunit [Hydrogenibacillus schlegelii]
MVAMGRAITEYADAIAAGRVIVGHKVKRVIAALADQAESTAGRWRFDDRAAGRVFDFINKFVRQSKGSWAGRPLELQLWQRAMLEAIYGFVGDGGERRFREAALVVGRKNGKSTIAAAIGLYMLIADGEGTPEIYSAATKRDQARIIFDEAFRMVSQSEALSRHVKKRKTDLYFEPNFGIFAPLAAEARTLDGLNSHCIIIDEAHAIRTRDLYDVLRQSTSARRRPLVLVVTTGGTYRGGFFDEIYEFWNHQIENFGPDSRVLPMLYELDDPSEWREEAAWYKANPNLGVSKSIEYMRDAYQRAVVIPGEKNNFLAKELNVLTSHSSAWISSENIVQEDIPLENFSDELAAVGVDLSSVADLTAAAIVFRKNGRHYVYAMYWLPGDRIETAENEDGVPYRTWIERGWMRPSGSHKIDHKDVVEWLAEIVDRYGVRMRWVGYDPWAAGHLVELLRSRGLEPVQVRQGFKTMTPLMREMEADLIARNIVVADKNQVTIWTWANATVEQDAAGNIKPSRPANRRKRIDGLIAYLNATYILREYSRFFAE